ncbi:hypothetical protein BGX33_010087 [Mortierella sp. NVP41]|nr:hypothetical protein BGX33_010087 [Mortierella sp. NVP41]
MNDSIFDLPELAHLIARHIPQGSLYQCVQVSKHWNAIFLPQLWRTFTDEIYLATFPNEIHSTPWSIGLRLAIRERTTSPQQLEWYRDVYRRHARFIRHLTITQPAILEACLEDAFATPPPPLNSSAANICPPGPSGESLITRLESLTIATGRNLLIEYFPEQYNDNNTFSTGMLDSQQFRRVLNPILEKSFTDACVKLVLCNLELQTLSCAYYPKILEDLQPLQPVESDAVATAVPRSLKNLSIVSHDGRLPKIPQSVRNLKVSFSRSSFRPFSESITPPSIPLPVYDGLEVLEMSYIENIAQIWVLLTQAPFLKTLRIESVGGLYHRNSARANAGASATAAPLVSEENEDDWPVSRVTILDFHQNQQPSLDERIFRCFPHLVEYHDDTWTPDMAAQLVKHCPFLEVVRITKGNNNSIRRSTGPRHFQKQLRRLGEPIADCVSILLSSFPRLRVLDIGTETIDASQVLETPWVCLDLEMFRCQIVGLPYLTKEEEQRVQTIREREIRVAGGETTTGTNATQQPFRTDEEDQLMDRDEQSIAVRRGIMAQLSKLTSLRHLTLSPDLKVGTRVYEQKTGHTLIYQSKRDGRSYIGYDDVLPDTPHLRLDSGLDQLSPLTKLEHLGFESMDHRMGTAEIEWIAKQFPRLKEMRGLSMDKHIGIEPDPKTDSLLALMRTLRPDVAHRQSFEGYGHVDMNFF